MVLVELTSIDLSDLPMEAFKAHLRLGTGFDDDAIQDEVLESYIRAAMAAIEARIGKMLLHRQVVWELTDWADAASQPLPVAPVSQVSAVATIDRTGSEVAIAPSAYRLERDTHRPKLVGQGGALPSVPTGGTVQVTFDAGYGVAWLDIPPDLREAVFLLAAHYYENRRDCSGATGLMPFGIMALLDAHRNIRILGSRA
ncbi:hypothetical protein [uncultured Litoreibacter sp.]|uniref:head-tail connector protein n=1 Tax=uncultured Litoreibacter sp. TaxID=1392394 RepID=UPI00261C9092|nr:hypothetical protein [uncultured Litoreibacter sp.]